MNSSKSINSNIFNGTEQELDGSCFSDEHTSSVATVSIQLFLSLCLFLVSVLGNALICFLLARSKRLQTVANILVGDLAVVDLLNILINGPLFLCYAVLDLDRFRGKLAAWFLSILHIFFSFLTLATMFMMMVFRYLVITRPLKFGIQQMKKKIIRAIVMKWSISLVIVLCVYAPLLKLDLGECATIIEYREAYAKESKQVLVRAFTPIMVLGSIVLFVLSRLALRKKQTADGEPELVVNQLAPKRTERKATDTILLTIALFIISYAPTILRSLHGLDLRGDAKNWLVFTMSYFLFIPNAVNPFLYLVRADNFRNEIKKLWEKRAGADVMNLQVKQENSQRTSRNRMPENPGPSRNQGLEHDEPQDAASSEERPVPMAKRTDTGFSLGIAINEVTDGFEGNLE